MLSLIVTSFEIDVFSVVNFFGWFPFRRKFTKPFLRNNYWNYFRDMYFMHLKFLKYMYSIC